MASQQLEIKTTERTESMTKMLVVTSAMRLAIQEINAKVPASGVINLDIKTGTATKNLKEEDQETGAKIERKVAPNQGLDPRKAVPILLPRKTKRNLLQTKTEEPAQTKASHQQAHHMMKNQIGRSLMMKTRKRKRRRKRAT